MLKWTIAVLEAVMTLTVLNAYAQQGDFNYRSSSPPQSQIQPNVPTTNTLELPPLFGPHLPPPSPAIPPLEVKLPSAFLGCWQGNPGMFDTIHTDNSMMVDVGSPGKSVFCYAVDNKIEIPYAEVTINAKGRALDVIGHLGLGYSSFVAHSLNSDVYNIAPTEVRAETDLSITQTDHWLYVIPSKSEQPSQILWVASLISPDTLLIKADQVTVYSPECIHSRGSLS